MSGVTHAHFMASRRRALALIGAGLALPLAPARAAGPEKIRLRDLWANGGDRKSTRLNSSHRH